MNTSQGEIRDLEDQIRAGKQNEKLNTQKEEMEREREAASAARGGMESLDYWRKREEWTFVVIGKKNKEVDFWRCWKKKEREVDLWRYWKERGERQSVI